MVRPQQISTEKIIGIARDCFLENGISVSMQEIADIVGLSQPALFKRFKTKNELIFAALAPPEKLPVVDWIEGGPREGDLRIELTELLLKLWETIGQILPRLLVLRTSKIDLEQFNKRYKISPLVRILQALSSWFARAQRHGRIRSDGNPDIWAQSSLGALQGRAALRYALGTEFGPKEDKNYVDTLTDLLLNGIKLETQNGQ